MLALSNSFTALSLNCPALDLTSSTALQAGNGVRPRGEGVVFGLDLENGADPPKTSQRVAWVGNVMTMMLECGQWLISVIELY